MTPEQAQAVMQILGNGGLSSLGSPQPQQASPLAQMSPQEQMRIPNADEAFADDNPAPDPREPGASLSGSPNVGIFDNPEFDAEGSGFDDLNAGRFALQPVPVRERNGQVTLHTQSSLPLGETEKQQFGFGPNMSVSLFLKGFKHPTSVLELNEVKRLGFRIVRRNGRIFFVKKLK